jgi:hypothetical protein
MCGRFAHTSPDQAVLSYFSARMQAGADLPPPRWNIRPTQDIAVVRLAEDGAREAAPMRWGFVPQWYSSPSDGPLMALLSVGRPEGFLPLVESVLPGAAQRTTLKGFRDHHPYTEADVLEIMAGVPGDTLLTTEKDAVKLLPFRDLLMRGGVRVFVLSMGIAMDERAEGILLRILDRVLEMGRAQGET